MFLLENMNNLIGEINSLTRTIKLTDSSLNRVKCIDERLNLANNVCLFEFKLKNQPQTDDDSNLRALIDRIDEFVIDKTAGNYMKERIGESLKPQIDEDLILLIDDVETIAEKRIVEKEDPDHTKSNMKAKAEVEEIEEAICLKESLRKFYASLNQDDDNEKMRANELILSELIVKLADSDRLKDYCSQLLLGNESCTISEHDLCLLLNSLVEISKRQQMSLKTTNVFIRHLLTDYLATSLNESKYIVSRKILNACIALKATFRHAFVDSFLVVLLINLNKEEKLMGNQKHLSEFLVKFIKDNFNEEEAKLTLHAMLLAKERLGERWNESIYQLVVNLVEKMANLSDEAFGMLIGKMRLDNERLASSLIFAKLLVSLLNKCNHKSDEKRTAAAPPIQTDDALSQLSFASVKAMPTTTTTMTTKSEPKSVNESNNRILPMEAIRHLVESNNTMMKRTLTNLLKSL